MSTLPTVSQAWSSGCDVQGLKGQGGEQAAPGSELGGSGSCFSLPQLCPVHLGPGGGMRTPQFLSPTVTVSPRQPPFLHLLRNVPVRSLAQTLVSWATSSRCRWHQGMLWNTEFEKPWIWKVRCGTSPSQLPACPLSLLSPSVLHHLTWVLPSLHSAYLSVCLSPLIPIRPWPPPTGADSASPPAAPQGFVSTTRFKCLISP